MKTDLRSSNLALFEALGEHIARQLDFAIRRVACRPSGCVLVEATKTSMERYGLLAARAALASIFIISGFGKLAGLESTAAYMASKGLPESITLAMVAGVTELVGGLMLVVGLRARAAAIALALLLLPATVLFHNPLGLSGAEAHMQQIHALKNIAIAGGLVTLAVWGAGAISLDAGREQWKRSVESAL